MSITVLTFVTYSVTPSLMKFFIRTFGCQMNVHDSTRIAHLLTTHGYTMCDTAKEPDIIIVNTCSVREKAWHKAVSEAGRFGVLKRQHPNAILVVAGCVAEQEKERFFSSVPSVDIVVGPDHYKELPQLLDNALSQKLHQVVTGFDKGRPEDFLSSYPGHRSTSASQFLTIMKGCSQKCTYCIVPSVRGPERDRDVDSILEDAKKFVSAGAREIVLLGQKVNGYKKKGVTFAKLLSLLSEIDGLERLRFTSPHPMHMTDELIQAFVDLKPLCEGIHLPVQAGSDAVLKRMKRRYSRADYIETAKRLKATVPGFQIYTDLIVGFPGESPEDFEQTLSLYEEVRFAGAFSFKYSPRPGTKAAIEMTDNVTPEEKTRRLDALHAVIERIERETRAEMVGQIYEILVEGAARLPGQMTGRTRNSQIVNVAFPKEVILKKWIGKTIAVEITNAMPHSLEGEIRERV